MTATNYIPTTLNDALVFNCGVITKSIDRPYGWPCLFIGYLAEGTATLNFAGACHGIPENMLIIIPPHIPYGIACEENAKILFSELSQNIDLQLKNNLFPCVDRQPLYLLQNILKEFKTSSHDSPQLISCYVTELFLIIKRLSQSSCTNVADACREYINNHFTENITNDMLSLKFGLSVTHLIYVFKTAYGMPPIRYLNHLRIEKAKQLVLQGLSISEIAVKLGFKNVYYFSRVFKKHLGVSPTEYKTRKI